MELPKRIIANLLVQVKEPMGMSRRDFIAICEQKLGPGLKFCYFCASGFRKVNKYEKHLEKLSHHRMCLCRCCDLILSPKHYGDHRCTVSRQGKRSTSTHENRGNSTDRRGSLGSPSPVPLPKKRHRPSDLSSEDESRNEKLRGSRNHEDRGNSTDRRRSVGSPSSVPPPKKKKKRHRSSNLSYEDDSRDEKHRGSRTSSGSNERRTSRSPTIGRYRSPDSSSVARSKGLALRRSHSSSQKGRQSSRSSVSEMPTSTGSPLSDGPPFGPPSTRSDMGSNVPEIYRNTYAGQGNSSYFIRDFSTAVLPRSETRQSITASHFVSLTEKVADTSHQEGPAFILSSSSDTGFGRHDPERRGVNLTKSEDVNGPLDLSMQASPLDLDPSIQTSPLDLSLPRFPWKKSSRAKRGQRKKTKDKPKIAFKIVGVDKQKQLKRKREQTVKEWRAELFKESRAEPGKESRAETRVESLAKFSNESMIEAGKESKERIKEQRSEAEEPIPSVGSLWKRLGVGMREPKKEISTPAISLIDDLAPESNAPEQGEELWTGIKEERSEIEEIPVVREPKEYIILSDDDG